MITSGSQFVSIGATIGIFRQFASATAIFSFTVSMIKIRSGAVFISLIPPR